MVVLFKCSCTCQQRALLNKLTHGGDYDCHIIQILADAEMTKLIACYMKMRKDTISWINMLIKQSTEAFLL